LAEVFADGQAVDSCAAVPSHCASSIHSADAVHRKGDRVLFVALLTVTSLLAFCRWTVAILVFKNICSFSSEIKFFYSALALKFLHKW